LRTWKAGRHRRVHPGHRLRAGGLPIEVKFACTARIVERARLAREALDIRGIVEVQELMTGNNNVLVTTVVPERDDLTPIARKLDEMGLRVEREELIRHNYWRPFDHFGTEKIEDDDRAVHEV